MRICFLTVGFVLLAGCNAPRSEPNTKEYIRLAVALGERDPDSLDFYFGPPDLVADIHKNPPRLEEIRQSATNLAASLESDPTERNRRIQRQLEAIAARAGELLGPKLNFDRAAAVYFGLRIDPSDRGDDTRTEIDHLLSGTAPLPARYAAFDAKFIVPPPKVQAVFERAAAGCRARTLERFSLPPGETTTFEYVHDKPWSAYSRYQGNFRTVIQLNLDFALTVDRLLDLACHEGYPGHHLLNVLHESRFVRGNQWTEWTVQPSFSPVSLVSEGLATIAADVAFPGGERLAFERDVLFPIAGFDRADAEKYDRVQRLIAKLGHLEAPIARDFVDGKLEWPRASAALESQLLMAHPEQTLKYISEYRSYMLTYALGHDLAARRVRTWADYQALLEDPDAAQRFILNP